MDVCFEGIGQVVATFRTEDKELEAGMAVTLKKSGTVGLGDGGAVCGVTVGAQRGGAVAVQIGGVVKVGCSDGSIPEAGYAVLACDGEGKVTVSEKDGVSCLVLAVDRDEQTAVIRL